MAGVKTVQGMLLELVAIADWTGGPAAATLPAKMLSIFNDIQASYV